MKWVTKYFDYQFIILKGKIWIVCRFLLSFVVFDGERRFYPRRFLYSPSDLEAAPHNRKMLDSFLSTNPVYVKYPNVTHEIHSESLKPNKAPGSFLFQVSTCSRVPGIKVFGRIFQITAFGLTSVLVTLSIIFSINWSVVWSIKCQNMSINVLFHTQLQRDSVHCDRGGKKPEYIHILEAESENFEF